MPDDELLETCLSGETVFRGKIINVEHWQARLPNGKVALREVVVHPGASAIVPVDADGMVTLVRQHRIAIGRLTWEIPAGKLDASGEDPLAAAKRELEEETGLRAAQWKLLTNVNTSAGFCNERIAVYLATELTQYAAHADEDEFLHIMKIPLSEAVARCMNGEIMDAKTIVGIMLASALLTDAAPPKPCDIPYIQRRAGDIPSLSCKE